MIFFYNSVTDKLILKYNTGYSVWKYWLFCTPRRRDWCYAQFTTTSVLICDVLGTGTSHYLTFLRFNAQYQIICFVWRLINMNQYPWTKNSNLFIRHFFNYILTCKFACMILLNLELILVSILNYQISQNPYFKYHILAMPFSFLIQLRTPIFPVQIHLGVYISISLKANIFTKKPSRSFEK